MQSNRKQGNKERRFWTRPLYLQHEEYGSFNIFFTYLKKTFVRTFSGEIFHDKISLPKCF